MKNPWTHVACIGCFRSVPFNLETLRTLAHTLTNVGLSALCPYSGDPIERSRLPGWHPRHECGGICGGLGSNGQLLMFGRCWDERQAGPPSAVDSLADVGRTEP